MAGRSRSVSTDQEQDPEGREVRRRRLLAQYALEEICAKTIFNLTSPSAPYDADSAFWVLPLAISLAREHGTSDLTEVSSLLKL